MASKDDIIKLVVSQTNYTNEEAEKKLEEHDYNYVMVVKEYLNPSISKTEKKEPKNNRSLNEQMMDEIRGFMDTANRQYLIRKEQQEKNKLIQQKIYEEFLEQKKLHPDCKYSPPNELSCKEDCLNPLCPGFLNKENKYVKISNDNSKKVTDN